jgi:hypothetical protein
MEGGVLFDAYLKSLIAPNAPKVCYGEKKAPARELNNLLSCGGGYLMGSSLIS